MALLSGPGVCTKLKSFRDLHANTFALCEENTFGIQTLSFACPFLSERVALCDAGGLFPLTFDTATFCFCVLAGNTWHCWSHCLDLPRVCLRCNDDPEWDVAVHCRDDDGQSAKLAEFPFRGSVLWI